MAGTRAGLKTLTSLPKPCAPTQRSGSSGEDVCPGACFRSSHPRDRLLFYLLSCPAVSWLPTLLEYLSHIWSPSHLLGKWTSCHYSEKELGALSGQQPTMQHALILYKIKRRGRKPAHLVFIPWSLCVPHLKCTWQISEGW